MLCLIKSLYFLLLTIYLRYLDQVLLPIAVVPFIYWNKAQKHFVGNACSAHTKPLSRMQSLSESREGS